MAGFALYEASEAFCGRQLGFPCCPEHLSRAGGLACEAVIDVVSGGIGSVDGWIPGEPIDESLVVQDES